MGRKIESERYAAIREFQMCVPLRAAHATATRPQPLAATSLTCGSKVVFVEFSCVSAAPFTLGGLAGADNADFG